jgi:hypothetical protein
MARSSIETSPRPLGSDRSHADLTDHVRSGSIFKPAAERSRKNYICEATKMRFSATPPNKRDAGLTKLSVLLDNFLSSEGHATMR